MENVIKHIVLDVSASKYITVLVKEKDLNTRKIIATITDNGKPYPITSSIVPRIKVIKADNTKVYNDCIRLENGDIEIDITEQMTICSGKHQCEIVLFDGATYNPDTQSGDVLHTMNFTINVKESVFDDDEVVSSDEFLALENALLQLDDINTKKHVHDNKDILDNTTASYTTEEKTKLNNIEPNAEVNQNAFSNVIVNDTTLSANSKTDNLTLEGDNISIIPDEENNKVTIGLTKDNITNVLGYEPGACEDIQEIEVVLSADNWIGTEAPYTQTVTVENLSLYNNCSIAISSGASSEQVNAITLADIGDISYEEDNKLTFIANGEKPSMDIPIIVCAAQSMNVVEVPYIEVENTEDIKADISLLKETKSPVLHSSTDLSYGGGTSAKYGHVKLSDNYTLSDGSANSSVGASSKAIFDAFSDIVSRLGSISETNSNYLKIGNYVIQWGLFEGMTIYNARVLLGETNLPVPFLDTNYACLGNAIFSISVTNNLINHMDNTVSIAQNSNTKLGLRVYNPNNTFTAENIANYPISVRWIAIGRWR